MKRGKKLLILLLVLLVLLGATALAPTLSRTLEDEPEEIVIFSVDAGAVTSLSWTVDGETLTFHCDNYLWTYEGDETLDLEDAELTQMVSELAAVVAYRTIEEPESFESYGLREPVCTIQVNGSDDLTLFLGNETGIGGQRYASIDDGKVYLIDESLMDVFETTLEDLTVVEETAADETTEN